MHKARLSRFAKAGIAFCWVLMLISLSTACRRDKIRVYQVPKEKTAGPAAAAPATPARPKLTWTTPDGWTELAADSMRVGHFSVKAADNREAVVTIIPLAGLAGGELDNVNRWRGQVGMAPVSEVDLMKLREPVAIAGEVGTMYDLVGSPADQQEATRILVARLVKEDTSWFFKMTGAAAWVKEQKGVFTNFLQSMHWESDATPAPAAGSTVSAAIGEANLQPDSVAEALPASWTAVTPGMMQTAKYLIAGEGGLQAEVSVTKLAGEAGGLLANINRWRMQLGLSPVTASELSSITNQLAWADANAVVVDIANETNQTRLVTALVPRSDQTVFYKLTGNETVVDREKAAFLRFVQSAR